MNITLTTEHRERIQSAAYFEAGRVVVATYLGLTVEAAWVVPIRFEESVIHDIGLLPLDETCSVGYQQYCQKLTSVSYAGPITEIRAFGECRLSPRASEELLLADKVLQAIAKFNDPIECGEVDDLWNSTFEIVCVDWPGVSSLANLLFERRLLHRSDILKVLNVVE